MGAGGGSDVSLGHLGASAGDTENGWTRSKKGVALVSCEFSPTMNAVLVIEYSRPNLRSTSVLPLRFPAAQIQCLSAASTLQVFSVQSENVAIFLDILDYLRDDLKDDLKAAYWFGSPQESYRLFGPTSPEWISSYTSV